MAVTSYLPTLHRIHLASDSFRPILQGHNGWKSLKKSHSRRAKRASRQQASQKSPKATHCEYSNETFRIIFKQCASVTAVLKLNGIKDSMLLSNPDTTKELWHVVGILSYFFPPLCVLPLTLDRCTSHISIVRTRPYKKNFSKKTCSKAEKYLKNTTSLRTWCDINRLKRIIECSVLLSIDIYSYW